MDKDANMLSQRNLNLIFQVSLKQTKQGTKLSHPFIDFSKRK